MQSTSCPRATSQPFASVFKKILEENAAKTYRSHFSGRHTAVTLFPHKCLHILKYIILSSLCLASSFQPHPVQWMHLPQSPSDGHVDCGHPGPSVYTRGSCLRGRLLDVELFSLYSLEGRCQPTLTSCSRCQPYPAQPNPRNSPPCIYLPTSMTA